MKRILGLILTAVFLSVLSIPCAAADTGRTYPGFSDVAEGSASYEAIKLCYERGLMNGTSETTFSPQGTLSIAQLVVLAARLYDLQNGGGGTVPDLPDLSQPCLRFYDGDGNEFASFTVEEAPVYSAMTERPYIRISDDPDAPTLPDACTLRVGYEGYNRVGSYEGAKESHESAGGAMHQGLVGTGYRFEDPKAGRFTTIPNTQYVELYKDAWWFPAVFYLGSEGVMSFDGELLYRASGGGDRDSYADGYDPLTRFSSDSASRALFAWLVDRTAGELPAVHETVSVPDVSPDETQDADAILRLYRAGILTGVDTAGRFHGGGQLTRAQAAMMLARVLDPASRV